MKFKIKSYYKEQNVHICEDENGNNHRLDILVDGDIDINEENKKTIYNDLIGKTIECEWTHPYIEIAHNVKILEDTK